MVCLKRKVGERMRKRLLIIYSAILGVGLSYILWLKFVGIGIPCVMNMHTGLLCPGCGTSRMLLSLLRGDFAGAWSYNPVTLCLVLLWNGIAVLCFIGKPKIVATERFLTVMCIATFCSLLIFGFLRNIL